jgi:hypothetical protein
MKKILLYLLVAGAVMVGGFFVLNNYIYQQKQGSGSSSAQDYADAGYTYFGNEARGDLDGDGVDDAAFIITRDGGGSGTFYYVGVAFATPQGYQGTNAVLLGDRIAPQTTEIRDKKLIVNYADRKPGEPMTTRPSVGVSKYFQVVNGIITPVKQ